MRAFLRTPNLNLRLIRLPVYSPDFNADEANGDCTREEVTANRCLGRKAKVWETVGQFFDELKERSAEVKQHSTLSAIEACKSKGADYARRRGWSHWAGSAGLYACA